jgi:hypothetical protein
MKLERQLKIALDESRLLILGSQVLFGFQFNGIFQQQFDAESQKKRRDHDEYGPNLKKIRIVLTALDTYVAAGRALQSDAGAAILATAAIIALLGFWYIFPLWRRVRV